MDSLQRIKSQQKQKENNHNALGLAGVGVGAHIANKNLDKATGLERKYHGTAKEKVPSILNEGLTSSRAGSGTSSQRVNLEAKIGPEAVAGKTYLGNKYMTSLDYAMQEKMFGNGEIGKVLNVNIPYEHLKKMNVVENPELQGMSKKEYEKYIYKENNAPFIRTEEKMKALDNEFDNLSGTNRFLNKLHSNALYNSLTKDTTVISGDVDPKYIKGSSAYEKYKLADMLEYIKNNKGRFGKGIAGVGTGLGIAGLGANELMSDKTAHEIYEYLEKVAFIEQGGTNITEDMDPRAYQLKRELDQSANRYNGVVEEYTKDVQNATQKPAFLTGAAAGTLGGIIGSRFGKNKGDRITNALGGATIGAGPGLLAGAIGSSLHFNKNNPEKIENLGNAQKDYFTNSDNLATYLKEKNYKLS